MHVTKIITHKKTNKGNVYLLQFSDDSKEYANEVDATIDCEKLLRKYKRDYMNTSKRTPKKKTNKNIIGTAKYKCSSTHDDIENFTQEPDSKYFAEGQSMWSATCLKCGIDIVHTTETGKFKPNIKFPAYTCIHRTKGCYKTMCNKCANLLILSSTKKRSR